MPATREDRGKFVQQPIAASHKALGLGIRGRPSG